jgi:RHS repeat-associated protein
MSTRPGSLGGCHVASSLSPSADGEGEFLKYNCPMDLPAGVSTSTYTYAGTAYANPHAPTTIGSTAYAYDNNGNVTSYGTTTVTWDYRNRITKIVGSGATTSYAYDINNERIQLAGGGSTTTFPFMLYNVASSTSAKIISKHLFANGEGIADVQGTGASAKAYNVHTDHPGGANIVSNASSTIENQFAYHAFGKARIKKTSANLSEQRQYIGQEYDQSTDLNYHHARYYSSTRGQFLSEDPILLAIGAGDQSSENNRDLRAILSDPQLENSYSYARNNPITFTDKNGKFIDVPWISNSQWAQESATAAYQQSSAWRFAMDHPNTTAALVAVGSYPALMSGGSAVGAFQMAGATGVGTTFAAQQTFAGLVYSALTIDSTVRPGRASPSTLPGCNCRSLWSGKPGRKRAAYSRTTRTSPPSWRKTPQTSSRRQAPSCWICAATSR